MTLADPNPPSGWPFRGLLTSSQMNLVRAGIMAAVDGVNGGVYTLLSKLTFAGTAMLEVGDKLQYTSRSITRTVPTVPGAAAAGWSFDAGNLMWITTAATSNIVAIPLDLPHGSTLTAVTVHYRGGTGHGGVLPTNMPEIILYSKPVAATAGTVLNGPLLDTAANAAAFEAVHSFGFSGLAHVINNTTHNYFLILESESGGSATSGAYLVGMTAACTVTSQSEWA